MLFVSFEGLDCSGKTTVIKKIEEQLVKNGYQTLVTREPGGNKISEKIRELLLNKNNYNMDYWTEALLYIASRSQHLKETILPALKAGKIVLCDRFLDSTTAYQGSGRGISFKELDQVQKIVIKNYLPDLTLFLDVSLEEMHNRQNLRLEDHKNRLDLEENDFYKKVKAGYEELIKSNEMRMVRIDANMEIDKVCKKCYDEIIKHLRLKK